MEQIWKNVKIVTSTWTWPSGSCTRTAKFSFRSTCQASGSGESGMNVIMFHHQISINWWVIFP
jgi:hypothetical protein